ncbi:hypothetical protein [Dyella nitratireducens]|uniref:Transposase n=1 Tax=Dyella nitratireducens TaxID=1849580 RepID=A0ABQ1FKD9_9GAMM|nr:hypothetical protein [Dyella nitratireducens]GGA19935.1 hypothetical protein GCM10010981_04950 [Dyella nitratireducens]GLQ44443.1 hypothetical protein GCM10007902_42930 [Dyella nitratireducens]
MTPQDFVSKLGAEVVDKNYALYRSLLLDTVVSKALDPYWQRVLMLFGELTADQREVLLELTRHVTIDAVANVLGVIDGTLELVDTDDVFRLTYGGRELGGDLQSTFLELAEQSAP